MSRRISADERPGRPAVEGRTGSGWALIALTFQHRLGQLRLLDRLLGHGRRARLNRAIGEEAGGSGNQEEDRRLDEEAGPGLTVEELFVEQPGHPLHDPNHGEEGEGAGGDADHRAAQDLAGLLAYRRLGELDLLADQRRGAFGNVED